MKGRISKSLVTNNDTRKIRLELEDKNSGVIVTIIEMTPEDFGLMMGGLGFMDCDFKVFNNYDILGNIK